MKIYFGETVRRLRRGKSLTQEQLAARLNVSFQTISKWERDESYPDITMLPVLAGFFGVKTDDLLGVNQAENERRIGEIVDAYDNRRRPMEELLPQLKAAVGEFPLDYRLWVRYMECLLYCAHGLEGILAVEKEVREIYENIDQNCSNDRIRIWAKRVFLMHLHGLAQPLEPGGPLGNPARQAECERILAEMPSFRTSREHIATMVTLPGEPHLRAVQEQIVKSLWLLVHALAHHDTCRAHPGEESTYAHAAEIIMARAFELRLCEELFPDGDYGEMTYLVIYTHGYLAFYRAISGDADAAFENLRRAVALACAFDAQPQMITHTSPLLAGLTYDKTRDDIGYASRLRDLFGERYPWPAAFRADPRFGEAMALLNSSIT